MSDSLVAPEIRATSSKEYRDYVADFTKLLRSAETLSAVSGSDGHGETLGVSEATGALTIGSGGSAPAVNGSAITTDDGRTIATGKAVQYWAKAVGGTVGETYTVSVLVQTSGGRTRELRCRHVVT